MDHNRIDALIDGWQEEIFERMKAWIGVNSVGVPSDAPDAPFGEGVRKALDLFLADAASMGFETHDCDGYAGHAQFGEGEKTMGVLAHLDIVPAGEGWTQNPFGGEIVGGKCFGRGTMDDKGPLLGALYALRAVKEAGVKLRHGVRIIAGCDEETGMSDMRYYASKLPMPDYGFSPDAEYPLINIEKGGAHIALNAGLLPSDSKGIKVYALHAGERANVVPPLATAEVGCDDISALSDKLRAIEAAHAGFKLEAAKGNWGRAVITATGVGAHASLPHLGVNAAGMLLIALKELGAADKIAALADAIGMEGDGKSLGIAQADELSGALTCNLGLLRYDGEKLEALLDIRYPLCAAEDKLVWAAAAVLNPQGIDVKLAGGHPPLHVPADSEIVTGLMQVYRDMTGDADAKPLAIGGGTYSRMMPNTVAFGICFPGDDDPVHMPDEFVYVDKFMLSIKIMARAIVKLAGA